MEKHSFIDDYSEAKGLIRKQFGSNESAEYFVAGGTLANIIIMSGGQNSHAAVIEFLKS